MLQLACIVIAVQNMGELLGGYMHLLWFLLVGLIAGWLASVITGGGGRGVLMDIVFGVIGSYVGGFLFRTLGITSASGTLGSIVVATIGAIIFIFLLRLFRTRM
jgi:uncharacterized membrane protein YeaQ/YmgE (transglycosylase-associated protein family)